MNTGAVSKLLGVSSSTVQRWVKHLGLEMERNEFGHYQYTEADLETLNEFKEQIQNGVPIQQIQVKKQTRRGSVKLQKEHYSLSDKVNKLERSIENKADSVVTYQLLQHRSEIEELKGEIEKLTKQIDELHTLLHQQPSHVNVQTEPHRELSKKQKKKTVFHTIFGF
ncbi:MerR family transcriptional regulator [Robertmurraya massiliosenegalensis]|uniref:MerR family transcriptional regulator n=1 Tax=Robertmurraya TaxID=2837507 RepID=UPI0039A77D62